ncbi:MAG: small multi-drug export protein [Desulfurococcales archaeon]|nr:small multi-drug export protein [Desulfurococcales archaeon]
MKNIEGAAMEERLLLTVILAGLTPGFEPRYAVALGVALGLGLVESLAASIASVLLLATALTAGVEALLAVSRKACTKAPSRLNPFCIYINSVEANRRRLEGRLRTWGLIALTLFVALPLPLTGMYTGAAAAALLGVRGLRLAVALATGGLASVAIVAVAAIIGITLN